MVRNLRVIASSLDDSFFRFILRNPQEKLFNYNVYQKVNTTNTQDTTKTNTTTQKTKNKTNNSKSVGQSMERFCFVVFWCFLFLCVGFVVCPECSCEYKKESDFGCTETADFADRLQRFRGMVCHGG